MYTTNNTAAQQNHQSKLGSGGTAELDLAIFPIQHTIHNVENVKVDVRVTNSLRCKSSKMQKPPLTTESQVTVHPKNTIAPEAHTEHAVSLTQRTLYRRFQRFT